MNKRECVASRHTPRETLRSSFTLHERAQAVTQIHTDARKNARHGAAQAGVETARATPSRRSSLPHGTQRPAVRSSRRQSVRMGCSAQSCGLHDGDKARA